MVNKEEVIAYADPIAETFEGLQEEDQKAAFPYDTKLKESETGTPRYPMLTVEQLMMVDQTEVAAQEEVKKLPWFLKTHIGDWVKVFNEDEKPGLRLYNENRLYVDYIPETPMKKGTEMYLTFSVTGEISKFKHWGFRRSDAAKQCEVLYYECNYKSK